MILATPEMTVGWADEHPLGRVGALASAAIDTQNKIGVTGAHGRSSIIFESYLYMLPPPRNDQQVDPAVTKTFSNLLIGVHDG